MKKIGIVGGIAWRSTVDYYPQLCQLASRHNTARSASALESPEFAIESLNLAKALELIGTDGEEASWSAFDSYFRGALERLDVSGADFAVVASNSPHHRLKPITRGLGLPVISMVDAVASTCVEAAVDQVLLLGTELTMRSPIYPRGLARHGCVALSPDSEELRRRIVALIERLQTGVRATARPELEQVVSASSLMPGSARAAICLACTELPLAFPEHAGARIFRWGDRLYISSTAAHIHAAFAAAIRA